MIVVTGAEVSGAECKINGVVSAELEAALKKKSWPKGSPSYMYKQYYAIIRKPN